MHFSNLTMDDFKKLVISKREGAGLTQAKFAQKLGVSWITIWRWENGAGKPKDDALQYWIGEINIMDKKND